LWVAVTGPRPTTTIIVCTRNRATALERALTSIVRDLSEVPREIIVVDNGSTDNSREIVDTIATVTSHSVKYVYEPKPGHSNAKNAGVRHAAGDLLLFTDDDVVVHSGWADALSAPFASDDRVVAAGGRVVPVLASEPDAWLRGPHLNQSALIDYGPDPRDLGTGYDLPFGANMALRRSALSRLEAPFHRRLGHNGRVAMGWDEWHVLIVLASKGRIPYVPDAVVEHHVDPARFTWERVRRGHFHAGFGLARHQRLLGESVPGMPRRVVRATRAFRRAARLKRRNARLSAPTAGQAWEEFDAFVWAGRELDFLLNRVPWASAFVADRLV
jgi:glycosyltransferase involved in cell wall biosynthesis